jgi:SAM-dependent methyltransferase
MTARSGRPSGSQQARDWDDLAELDPLWAVLSEPEFSRGAGSIDKLFASGAGEVSGALDVARELGRPERFGTALDFGCGVGRLSRALAARFERVTGVDVSRKMLEAARELNADVPNVEFVLNSRPDLSLFESGSFDLVYSSIVLQHLRSGDEIERFVKELVRLTAVDGLAVFQIPSAVSLRYRLQPRRRAYGLLRGIGVRPRSLYRRGLNPIQVRALPESRVRELVEAAGGRVERVVPDSSVPPLTSNRYFAASATGPRSTTSV